MTTILFGMALPWLLVALGIWLGSQLVRQNRHILLRLQSIEGRLARDGEPPGGLPVGAAAPDFELPDLAGVRRKLSDFREQNVLLVFFSPRCGFCTKMAPNLAALPLDGGDGRPVPLVVSTGDAEENRKYFEHHGIRCVVLLQEQNEVASLFGAQGSPMGYRIDGTGRIATGLTIGAESLLQLATTTDPGRNELRASANGSSPDHAKRNGRKEHSSLARSRLNRNGLKAGAAAPEFCLPRLDGGKLSLSDFRGRRVLLVFSDPNCRPCDELAPQLQELHCRRTDLAVLVVSRGDAQANRAKAAALGLTFPMVLQRHWEISLQYAMFSTPIGYLIDEQGVLVSDVAMGAAPIMALADQPLAAPSVSAAAELELV